MIIYAAQTKMCVSAGGNKTCMYPPQKIMFLEYTAETMSHIYAAEKK